MKNQAVTSDSCCCPACDAGASHLLDWEYSGLGDSIFNYTAAIHTCRSCGLVFVQNIDDAILAKFYAEECSYFEKPHFAVASPANQEKYNFYARFLRQQGIDSVDMADIGCGRGGFVDGLAKDDWRASCIGVDVDVRSLPTEEIAEKGKAAFRSGGALSLPFDSDFLGLLTYFHVLEHIHDLQALLQEARRVLRPGGHILIEVPDAENYASCPIGPAFWLSIREHIHHFTAAALVQALNANGFSAIKVSRQMLPTPEFSYPSLMILAVKGESSDRIEPPSFADVAAFALESRQALMQQAQEISRLAKNQVLSVWGCSAELLSLLPLLDVSSINICDASKHKQRTHYKQRLIHDPSALPIEGVLLVAPSLHREVIKAAALQLGWDEAAIHTLK